MGRFLFASFFLCVSMLSADNTACQQVTEGATHLTIVQSEIEVKGRSSSVYKIILDDGAEFLQKREGECFNVIVENHTAVPTSLHWHGLILPPLEDGVSYISQPPIPPGKSYPYNFSLVQAGTYFAHSHYGLQEQKLMSIPLILLPKEKSPYRDVVVYFEDFTFQSIDAVWQNLRKNYVEEAKTKGSSWKPNLTPPMMNMRQDLNDVDFDAYLSNRTTLDKPTLYHIKAGEQVRLRLINAASASGFLITLGKLKGTLIAVDGNPIEPISLEEYSLAPAQRIDIVVSIPEEGGAFPILAQGQGTDMLTGVVLTTKGVTVPALSMQAPSAIGAITNAFEKQLRALHPLAPKKVDRTLIVELEGDMHYYTWAINNHVWPDAERLTVKEGERVEMVFINKTGMSHPMHLHGHFFQVVEIDGQRFSGALRDTVLVMPNQTLKVQFDANHPGMWPLHCHIAYHLWAGMMAQVIYEGYTPIFFSPSVIRDYSRIYGGY